MNAQEIAGILNGRQKEAFLSAAHAQRRRDSDNDFPFGKGFPEALERLGLVVETSPGGAYGKLTELGEDVLKVLEA